MSALIDMLGDLLKWLVGAVLGLGLWIWKKTDGKVEALDATKASKTDMEGVRKAMEQIATDLKSKADEAEMNRQRDNISALFNAQTSMRQEMHANHVAMMTTMNTIATQVAKIAGRLERDK